jgi:hypothetical protein
MISSSTGSPTENACQKYVSWKSIEDDVALTYVIAHHLHLDSGVSGEAKN